MNGKSAQIDVPENHKQSPMPRNKSASNDVNEKTKKAQNTPKTSNEVGINKKNIDAPVAQKEKWKISDKIALLTVLVNAAMLLATYRLFQEAHSTTQVAKETLDSTKAYTKRAEGIRRSERTDDKTSQRKKDILDSLTFNEQRRSVNAQIKSLQDNEKNFEIDNRAYLQAEHFDTLSLLRPPPNIAFVITNAGKQPVKILKAASIFALAIANAFDYKSVFPKQFKVGQDNSYVTASTPYVTSITVENPIPYYYGNDIKSGFYSFYIEGRYLYQNLGNGKVYLYKFVVEVNFANRRILYRFRENDNVEQKDIY